MAYSEVEIVNIALNTLGKASIRDFSVSDDDPKSGRISERLYNIARDKMIAAHDWSFARKTVELKKLTEEHAEGVLYALPSDCFVPRRLYPRGAKPNKWRVESNCILILHGYFNSTGTIPKLRYTATVTKTGYFPPHFVDALSMDLAKRLCMPMTRDKKFYRELKSDANMALLTASRIDANSDSGDEYVDLDTQYDSFLEPDGNRTVFYG